MDLYLSSVKRMVNIAKLKNVVAVAKAVVPKKGIFSWLKGTKKTENLITSHPAIIEETIPNVTNKTGEGETSPLRKESPIRFNFDSREPEPEIISDFTPLHKSTEKDDLGEVSLELLGDVDEGDIQKNDVKGVSTHPYDFKKLNQPLTEPEIEPITRNIMRQEKTKMAILADKSSVNNTEREEVALENKVSNRWKSELKPPRPNRGKRKLSIYLGGSAVKSSGKNTSEEINISSHLDDEDAKSKEELNNSIDYPMELALDQLDPQGESIQIKKNSFEVLQKVLFPTVFKLNYIATLLQNLANKTESDIKGIIQFRKNIIRSYLAHKKL